MVVVVVVVVVVVIGAKLPLRGRREVRASRREPRDFSRPTRRRRRLLLLLLVCWQAGLARLYGCLWPRFLLAGVCRGVRLV